MAIATARKENYQNTTVRMPKKVYECAKTAVDRLSDVSSLNEFVVEAVVEKLQTLKEAEIDAAFAKMATDLDYQRDAIALTREFETSDRDALEAAERATNEYESNTNTRTSQAASR